MADGIIRPRPQPLGRYLTIRATQPLARPALTVAVVLAAAADLGHLDTLATIARHWQGLVLAGYLAAGIAIPAAAALFVARRLRSSR